MPNTSKRKRNSRTGGTAKNVFRTAVGSAPLALALLNALIPSPKQTAVIEKHGADSVMCGEGIADYEECHSEYPSGCSERAGYDSYLNILKNQINFSPAAPAGKVYSSLEDFQALDEQTPDGVRDHHRDYKDQLSEMGEGQIREMTGWLYYYKRGGEESSNCQLTGDENVDYHIGIGFDKSLVSQIKPQGPRAEALKQNSVVVEMTPQYRAEFEPDWTIAALKEALGKKVRVQGQLLLDSEHFRASDDCSFDEPGPKCWRASAWELHPVTKFQFCAKDNCDPNSQNGWVDLGGSQGQK